MHLDRVGGQMTPTGAWLTLAMAIPFAMVQNMSTAFVERFHELLQRRGRNGSHFTLYQLVGLDF